MLRGKASYDPAINITPTWRKCHMTSVKLEVWKPMRSLIWRYWKINFFLPVGIELYLFFLGWTQHVTRGLQTEVFGSRVFRTKAVVGEDQLLYYLTHCLEDKEVHTFPSDISPKVNVIARLEFEHTNCDSVVQHLNHYSPWVGWLCFMIYQPLEVI